MTERISGTATTSIFSVSGRMVELFVIAVGFIPALYFFFPGKLAWFGSIIVDIFIEILPDSIFGVFLKVCRLELLLSGFLEAKVDSFELCVLVFNILARLNRRSNPAILEMILNPDIDLRAKLLKRVIDFLQPNQNRVLSPSQKSTLVAHASLFFKYMVDKCEASQVANRATVRLMEELLNLVPDDVKVVSASLTAMPLSVVDQSLLDKIPRWIEIVHDAAVAKPKDGKPFLIEPALVVAIEKIISTGMIPSTFKINEMLEALEWASFTDEQKRLVKVAMRKMRTEVDLVLFDSISTPALTNVKEEEASTVTTVAFSGPDGSPNYAISGVSLHPRRQTKWQVEIVNPGGGFMVLGIIGKKRPTSSLSCYNSTCYGWSSGKYVYVGGSDKSQSGDLNPWDGWKMGDKGIFTYTPSHYTLSLQLLRGRMRKEFFIDNCVLDEAFIHFFFCFNGSTVRFSKDI